MLTSQRLSFVRARNDRGFAGQNARRSAAVQALFNCRSDLHDDLPAPRDKIGSTAELVRVLTGKAPTIWKEVLSHAYHDENPGRRCGHGGDRRGVPGKCAISLRL